MGLVTTCIFFLIRCFICSYLDNHRNPFLNSFFLEVPIQYFRGAYVGTWFHFVCAWIEAWTQPNPVAGLTESCSFDSFSRPADKVQGAMSSLVHSLDDQSPRLPTVAAFWGPTIPVEKVGKRQGIRLPSAAVPQKDGGAETRWLKRYEFR